MAKVHMIGDKLDDTTSTKRITKDEMRQQVNDIRSNRVSLDSLVTSTAKVERQSTSDWTSRSLEDNEVETLEYFDGMEVKLDVLPVKELDLAEFKLVSNKAKAREFYVLTDTGAKSLKRLATIKLANKDYNIMYRLTINLELA